MGVCEHPQKDVQVTRARRRALHSISPQNCCSVPVTPRAWLTIILPHRMTQITHVGIKYKPVFTHSLQFSFLRACYNPSASPHAARPPGSIVTNTTTGAQAPATYIKQFMNSKSGGNTQNSAPRCSASLPPAISYTLIFLPRLLPVKLLLMSEAWISDHPFSGTSHTSAYIVAASKKTPQFSQNSHSDNTV